MKHTECENFNIFNINFGSNNITFEEKFNTLFIKFSLIDDNELYLSPSQSNSFKFRSAKEKPNLFLINRIGSQRDLNISATSFSFFINEIEIILEIESGALLLTSQSDQIKIAPNSGNSFYIEII